MGRAVSLSPDPPPPPRLTWDKTMVEVMKIMATSFKRSCTDTAAFSVPNPAAGHHWPTPPMETPGYSQASLGQFLWGSLVLSPGSWCTQAFPCVLQESVSPVLCKFCQLYGGVNGDLLQNGLCHSQVCCTQSPCPCSRPLLTIGDTQTLKGRSGSVSVESHGLQKLLFEPSECLRWVWGLILNVILSLLLSCLGFSFALGWGVSLFSGFQHSPFNGYSYVSCNFGVLAGEDECTSFSSAILIQGNHNGLDLGQIRIYIYIYIYTHTYFTHCLSLAWWIFSITLPTCEMSTTEW